MYTRIKRIKGAEYAYEVENKWTRKGARQKTKKYLGRVHRLERNNEKTLADNLGNGYTRLLEKARMPELICELLKVELENHGFAQKSKHLWTNGTLNVDVTRRSFKSGERDVVLALNEGLMSKRSIKKLIFGNYIGEQREAAFQLARAFVDAGFALQQETFIDIFRKVHND